MTSHDSALRPVRSILLETESSQQRRSFSGICRASADAKLSFKLNGNIAAIEVRPGDRVSKGQLLARLDEQPFRVQLQQARALVTQAEAGVKSARSSFATVQQLYESGTATKLQFDQAKGTLDALSAQLVAAQQQVRLASLQLEYTSLYASDDGVVALILAEVGENTGAGYPVLVLSSGGKPEVKLAVSAEDIVHLEIGQQVEVRVEALDNRLYSGEVIEKGLSPEPGSATYPVRVVLDEGEGEVLTGMVAEASIVLPAAELRLVVPLGALAEDVEGVHVFVLEVGGTGEAPNLQKPGATGEAPNLQKPGDGDYVAQRRAVELGAVVDGGVELLTGVAAGERLVLAGVHSIRDGEHVRVLLEPASVTPQAPAASQSVEAKTVPQNTSDTASENSNVPSTPADEGLSATSGGTGEAPNEQKPGGTGEA
ncbi:MAG: efflux RND transporter periplasmic adaptor subunit, partial [Myxococcota bacterium]|nr:efflux RND transporter periplasmic adaptor subunit [Myxococcota bacterium]